MIHPNLSTSVENDINLLRGIAWAIEVLPPLQWLDLPNAVEEFNVIMSAQIDLRREAENLERFRENFRDDPCVTFPKPYTEMSSENVLIEAFSPGVPVGRVIAESSDAIKKHIGKIISNATMKMLFQHNLSHGDMHQGNILVTGLDPTNLAVAARNNGMKGIGVTLIDVGITAQLSPTDWVGILAMELACPCRR